MLYYLFIQTLNRINICPGLLESGLLQKERGIILNFLLFPCLALTRTYSAFLSPTHILTDCVAILSISMAKMLFWLVGMVAKTAPSAWQASRASCHVE